MVGRAKWESVSVSPWPGEVLAAGENAGVVLEAGHGGDAERGDSLRVGPVGAVADDGVLRIAVNI